MKIIFDYIEIEGFRSVVSYMRFILNRPGLNLIKGINGAGKTTVFEALVWCLFGINLKDTNIAQVASWPEVRTNTYLGTRVSVTLYINDVVYCITRHLDFKGKTYDVKGEDCLILVKGDADRAHKVEIVGNFRNKAETQEQINNLLGLDAKTFMNSIFFGQRMAKLIEQDNGDKRKLFETLFETEWVTLAKAKCDKDISKYETELVVNSGEIRGAEYTIEQKLINLEQVKTMSAGYEDSRINRIYSKEQALFSYKEDLNVVCEDLLGLQESLEKLKYNPAAHDELDSKHDELTNLINKQELEENKKVFELKEAKNNVDSGEREVDKAKAALVKLQNKKIEDTCPYCEQDLKPGNKLEKNHILSINEATVIFETAEKNYKNYKNVYNKLLKTSNKVSSNDLNDRLSVVNEQLGQMNDIYDKHEAINNKIDIHNKTIIQLKKDILRVNNEIDAIKAEKLPSVDTKAIEKEIAFQQDKLKKLQQDKLKTEHDLEIAKWWSAKAFSAGGIKAFIFKAMLTQLNQNVKKYGQQLGASLEFSIDLTKASKPFTTICSLGDKINKEYKEFSGGEKQKLDIALISAMHDLISMNTNINVLIMDEVFEGLSEDGEAAVFDLIRGKADEGRSVYVMTHSANLDSLYANTIEFQRINNNTVILN